MKAMKNKSLGARTAMSARTATEQLADMAVRAPFRLRVMTSLQDTGIVETSHKSDRRNSHGTAEPCDSVLDCASPLALSGPYKAVESHRSPGRCRAGASSFRSLSPEQRQKEQGAFHELERQASLGTRFSDAPSGRTMLGASIPPPNSTIRGSTSTVRRSMLFRLVFALLLPCASLTASEIETNQPSLILVVGAPGEPEYGSNFVRQVQLWTETCNRADAHATVIGLSETNSLSDRDLLQQTLESQQPDATAPLWLVLVGHGTFDGKEARFNLRGPDLSPADLAEWLKPFHRPLIVIDASSASAPFLNTLSATNRVIITATRSGSEVSFSRFGQYLAEAMDDPQSDLDKDQQISLLEAFVTASDHVEDFYKTEDRLATEHALLDDNGDGRGTPADWFHGIEVIKKPEKGSVDGTRAQQIHLVLSPAEQSLSPEIRAKRDVLELQLAQLREEKSDLDEDEYYRRIEKVLLELARLYARNTATNSPVHEPLTESAN